MKKIRLSNLFLLAFLAIGFAACDPKTEAEEITEVTEKQLTQSGGLALYTLRDSMALDPKATLKAVADAGYAYVETANYDNGLFYGMAPTDFKVYLESLGLTAVSAHMGMVTMENADQLIADVKAAGISYFVIPVPPMGMFTFGPEGMGMKGNKEDLLSILITLGEKCSNAGLKLLYHNHDFEFKPMADGTILADYILENTDPAQVNFQMDLFWVTKAGADPLT
jgi:sugar phosphate isomerase/epimerase